ncbi:MarR family transcriptional regulator [Paenibacillus sp. L3-i20]|uniref:LexA family protein n=1 Tax=Paenibacillus sp. L3-i20 TaxID=2905833 RepID=UPI001EDCDB61|nr:MarR family transcriptional regulator [Paenibacillus sp. L3-i20]GKU80163.1 hypothetical protein L3i20_v245600 [Paenibacillus sp. L3-i20]
MTDQELIAQINECLDKDVAVSISKMKDALRAYRRENKRLKGVAQYNYNATDTYMKIAAESEGRNYLLNQQIIQLRTEHAAENDRLKAQKKSLANGLKQIKGTQAKVFDYLVQFIGEHGYSPSQREIADALGLQSSSTVNGHLERLEKKGYIDRNGGRPRAIKILGMREEG